MGVEPIPPGSQPGMQKPLHHGHHGVFDEVRNPNDQSHCKYFVIRHSGFLIFFSSPTRIRTWNARFEARHDVRFNIRPK